MLNQWLYDTLVKAFGDVAVANENDHASIIPAPALPCMWRTSNAGSRGEQYHVNCPFCGDKRKRLYISYLSYARPVVNGVQLPPGPLLSFCQNEHCTDKQDNRLALEAMISHAMNGISSTVVVGDRGDSTAEKEGGELADEVSLEGIRTWVPDYEPVTEKSDPVILEYLASRRITQADIDWLKIGCGPIRSKVHGALKNGASWVIFPIIQNHRLCGVQARCPEVYMDPGDKMKYWLHPGCRKATLLYNIDMARSLGIGVVCEGVFDVASVGLPGVCCFGHTPSMVQKSLLASIGSCLIWLPDTDSNKDCNPVQIARTQVAKWNDASVFVRGAHVVTLPAKDAGSLTRAQVWSTILHQVPEAIQGYLMKDVIPKLHL